MLMIPFIDRKSALLTVGYNPRRSMLQWILLFIMMNIGRSFQNIFIFLKFFYGIKDCIASKITSVWLSILYKLYYFMQLNHKILETLFCYRTLVITKPCANADWRWYLSICLQVISHIENHWQFNLFLIQLFCWIFILKITHWHEGKSWLKLCLHV